MDIYLKVTVEKGDGKGGAETSEIADMIVEELLDGQSVYVDTQDGEEQREYRITSAENHVV